MHWTMSPSGTTKGEHIMKKFMAIAIWLFACQHILGFLNGQGTDCYTVNPTMLIGSLCGLVFLTIPAIGYMFFGWEA